ncbi:MAG TPA: acetolactate synthase small subunit [Defluviitaleaceae bacterium]|jgi:acetolactate synthase-1/3 small subunit|nr:acetolactate synthase small subunit [Candidatus Epulonipiscium sp.]HOQ16036.1 acetolactate synthase small subunit [Defluviitaleaceae bacterium]HPT76121.1 acetolactate synthase small subunit [Defluviitaleaceae bacterium]HQD49887.1 acetolactate synthase small subunit [Defluviitaleaceae bacterium]
MKRYVLSVLVENHSGVLSRVSGLFSRRGYNIDSLTVGVTEDPNTSRMTIVVKGDKYIVEQIKKQLNKLIDVIKVIELKPESSVYRELILIKVSATTKQRAEIIEIVNVFRGRIVDVVNDSLIIELTGDESKIEALINMLEPYGIKEIIRTGLTALERGNKVIKEHN